MITSSVLIPPYTGPTGPQTKTYYTTTECRSKEITANTCIHSTKKAGHHFLEAAFSAPLPRTWCCPCAANKRVACRPHRHIGYRPYPQSGFRSICPYLPRVNAANLFEGAEPFRCRPTPDPSGCFALVYDHNRIPSHIISMLICDQKHNVDIAIAMLPATSFFGNSQSDLSSYCSLQTKNEFFLLGT
jgi:hypothetical protein